MTLALAILAYAAAMIAANLLVAALGPWVSPINAFFLIGLDLALRDWLHFRLRAYQMALLIAATGALTLLLNPAADRIAIASSVSFIAAALLDWTVFARMARWRWFQRANASNAAGAAIDSILFPTLAFGALMPSIVGLQFVAKVAGGALWTFLLTPRNRRF